MALGFYAALEAGENTTDSSYLSGLSRQHIWIFAAALDEQDSTYNGLYNCPCTNTNVALHKQGLCHTLKGTCDHALGRTQNHK